MHVFFVHCFATMWAFNGVFSFSVVFLCRLKNKRPPVGAENEIGSQFEGKQLKLEVE